MGKLAFCLPLLTATRALYVLIGACLAGNDAVYALSATNLQIPPLQWINLTGLLGGSPPPPLKDATIGYDDTTRLLVIFGGESEAGIPQSQTYLLDLDTLTWRQPSPPGTQNQQPSARTAAISAPDSAANYRTGHVVFGGKGADGKPLSDVWEFSFNFEFWTNVKISPGDAPSPRWAAAGGRDFQTPFIQDIHETAPNTTFFVAGGFDSNGAIPLSDLWQFNISGALASNLVNNTQGSWQKLSLHSTLPPVGGSATSVVFQNPNQYIAAIGGCGSTPSTDAECAQNGSYVLNVGTSTGQAISQCPAPRTGATIAQNYNTASSTFAVQVFQTLGIIDKAQWDDGGGLDAGEVDVLALDTGSWARVIPAGDPSQGQGKPAFPVPREGAVSVSYPQALVGFQGSRTKVSDTIIFGGRDASGNYLSDVWLLRAYNGAISQSNQKWSGFGSGNLQSGINADGEGVTVTYITDCARFIGNSTTTTSPPGSPSSTTPGQPAAPSSGGASHTQTPPLYDASTTHKVLSPVAVAAALPAMAIYRLSLPSVGSAGRPGLLWLAGTLASAAFAVGVAGLATAFTSATYTPSLVKRSSPQTLATAHGKAGIALFAGLVVVIIFSLVLAVLRYGRSRANQVHSRPRPRAMSSELAEKEALRDAREGSPEPQESNEKAHSKARSRESAPWPFLGHTRRRSSESLTASGDHTPPASTGSFEVTNRPTRARHASAHSLAAFSDPRSATTSPHNLADMSWVGAGRSASRLDGIDDGRRHAPSTPGTAVMEIMSTKGFLDDPSNPELPSSLEIIAHILLHGFLLALSILCLIALFTRAPVATFAVFLAWVVIFYALIFVLAWHGVPRVSVLTVLVTRLRTTPSAHRPHPPLTPEGIPFPTGHGPYQNQPSFRTAHGSDYPGSHAGHTIDDYEDDEDDDARQRRIEDEMSRRDVTIITVPRRKLVPLNPDPEHMDP